MGETTQPARAPMPGGEHEGEGDHIPCRDAAERGRIAVRGAGPHLPAEHGVLEEEVQEEHDDGADADAPEHLGRYPDAAEGERRDLVPGEVGQGADALAPDDERRLAHQDRDADGDDDHPRTEGLTSHRMKVISIRPPMIMVISDRRQDGERQGQEGVQGHGGHAAQHHELALCEIDDARGVVDDVEPDADDCVDGSVGEAGHEVLKEKLDQNKLQ